MALAYLPPHSPLFNQPTTRQFGRATFRQSQTARVGRLGAPLPGRSRWFCTDGCVARFTEGSGSLIDSNDRFLYRLSVHGVWGTWGAVLVISQVLRREWCG